MGNRKPIEMDEWYHCYNRGVDKRKVFLGPRDYERMLILMYLANDEQPVRLFVANNPSLRTILAETSLRDKQSIVDIGAYALMPNHLHLVLKEIREGGIALFMQKVFTGYTMYFNQKNERTGALFAGTFKSKHIEDDQYLQHLISYVHLNPAELFNPNWKEGLGNLTEIEGRLRAYPYSSLPEFIGVERQQRLILGSSIFQLLDTPVQMKRMMQEARTYESLQL